MRHFDFIVDLLDAENIMGFMQDGICKSLSKILDLMADEDMSAEEKASHIKWHRSHIKYIEELKTKMKHSEIST